VSWAIEHVLEAGFDRTFVVTGAVDLSAIAPSGVELVENPNWAAGQATSLQCAIAAARAAQLGAIVVGLGDQPIIEASTWRAVASRSAPIAVATFDGQRRNPVRLAEAIWGLLPHEGDEGARVLMRARPDLVSEVMCSGNPIDIDTIEDLSDAGKDS
jgi:CTP:molybdopterin cytidylyltransferase MocA